MHGLWAKNHIQAASTEGRRVSGSPEEIQFWTGKRPADWKVANRFVSIGELLRLGAHPSGVQLGNADPESVRLLEEENRLS
jgi:hypothetical protein